MVLYGIADHLPENEHYWVDTADCCVESKDKAAGHKCKIKLKHPDHILFGDEVGTDTAQDGDGHIGGQTYITIGDRTINLTSSKSSNHFTLIGLTAANGDPVMCIVIIAGKELGIEAALGFDHQSDTPYDTNKTLEENFGPGKALPGLPRCSFRGKEVPGLLAVTPKGSITSKILRKALETLDNLGIYQRSEGGPTPMIILDGHDSRLQVPFLEYVNKKKDGKSIWRACIGLPNATAKWQVGDSNEQNGSYKMAMTKEKDKLLRWKRKHQMPLEFQRSDILPLVFQAWDQSFARQKQNLSATLDRGWYHIDRRLLKDPEILRTKVTYVNSPSTRITAQVQVPDTPNSPAVSALTEDTIG